MNINQTRRTTDFTLTIVLMLITGVMVVLWSIFASRGMDDNYFRTVLENDDIDSYIWCFNRRIENYADALTSAGNLFRYNIGRWPNLLHILFVPLPVIVERIFNSLVIIAIFYMMTVIISGERRPKALFTAFATAAIWVALPWYDSLYSLAFQANYIWTTALLTGFILLLPRAMNAGWGGRTAFMVYCILLGECHEGFSLTAGAYTFALLCMNKDKRKFLGAVLLFIFIGFCTNILAGTWDRYNELAADKNFDTELPSLLSRMASNAWPLWCAPVLFTIRIAAVRSGRKAYLRETLPYLLGILVNILIIFSVHGTGRTGWAGIVMAILLTGATVRPWLNRTRHKTATVIVLTFTAIYALWAFEAVKWQIKMKKETDTIIEAAHYRRPAWSDVFPGPYTPTTEIPYYLMGVVRNPIDDDFTQQLTAAWEKPGPRPPFILAISPLMEGPYEEWPVVAGSAGIRGVWPMIVTDNPAPGPLRFTFDTDIHNFTPINRLLVLLKEGRQPKIQQLDLKYRTDIATLADGREVTMFYIEPLPRTVEGRKLLRIDTIPEQ